MGVTEENFGRIWPVHVDGLIAFLTRLRAAFDGDLDASLIMAVIGSAVLPRGRIPSHLTYKTFRSTEHRGVYHTPLNTLSISQITGIPRETVRRKLTLMARKGWIGRDGRGYWHLENKAAAELEPITQYSLDYLNRIAALFQEENGSGEMERAQ